MSILGNESEEIGRYADASSSDTNIKNTTNGGDEIPMNDLSMHPA